VIERLRGTVLERDAEGVVLDVGGVGYRVLSPAGTGASPGEECTLYIRMVVREESMTLFGFSRREEREAFDEIVSVSRVGPRLALSVLSVLSPAELSSAVAMKDVTRISSVPGLGKKTAERVVLELGGKELAFSGDGDVPSGGGGAFLEARDALVGLGYSIEEAEAALGEVDEMETSQDYIREALARIGGRR
jgi:Holliday junction DNA helicase RuvA